MAVLLTGRGAARAQAVDAEEGFATRIAEERAAHGLAALSPAADLQAVARRHAQRMADRGEPYHNPDLGSEADGWSMLGENVGVGPEVDAIHQGFMGSDDHRHIILSGELAELGVGVVRAEDGRLWVVQVFRRPAEPAPDPSPPPSPGDALPSSSPPSRPAAAAPAAPTAPSTTVETTPEAAATVAAAAAPRGGVRAADLDGPRLAARRVVATGAVAVAVAPDLRDLTREVPPEAWVAAFLLAGVVGMQGQALRRLGLVA